MTSEARHLVGPKIAVLGVPDRYIPHAKPDVILAQLGLVLFMNAGKEAGTYGALFTIAICSFSRSIVPA